MKRFHTVAACLVFALGCAGSDAPGPERSDRGRDLTDSHAVLYDVVIYGGTSGGIAAAVQVASMGYRPLVIEPGQHLGGLTSGGLGATDIGNKAAIGGVAREFYREVMRHYAKPSSWRQQQPSEYRNYLARRGGGEDTMWTFEPHVAEAIYRRWVADAGIEVVYGERLHRGDSSAAGVVRDGARIVSIRLESGRTISGRVFIDASYEGDLLAAAGVSYTVGREANALYGETLNGVQTKNALHHQMHAGVDPYVVPGDPSSGLLPGIDPNGAYARGDGEGRRARSGVQPAAVCDRRAREPHTVCETRGLRRELVRALVSKLRGG